MNKQLGQKIVLLDIDDTMFNTALLKQTGLTQFEIYQDVQNALEELAQVASLGIFSQGEIAFQKQKLKKTNIHHFFAEEYTHIVKDKIKAITALIQIYKSKGKLFIVEDRLDVLKVTKECQNDIFTIWMKRGRYANSQRNPVMYTPDAIVTNLYQVVPIIKAN